MKITRDFDSARYADKEFREEQERKRKEKKINELMEQINFDSDFSEIRKKIEFYNNVMGLI
jgi:Txe/YoeB family toxin of Txe-Axe toxin-antitoxin module